VEVQGGLFRNQETYAFLQPRQTIRFSEYWMPVREIGGISRANLTGVVYLSRKNNTLLVGLNVNQPMKNASLRVTDGNQAIFDEKLLLALETYQQALTRYHNSVALQKAAGRVCATLLRFGEAQNFLEAVHDHDITDAEASYYLGTAYEALGNYRAARGAYESAYRLPNFRAPAALRLGELSAREGNLNEAELYLQEALHAEPDDVRTAEELVATRRALGKS